MDVTRSKTPHLPRGDVLWRLIIGVAGIDAGILALLARDAAWHVAWKAETNVAIGVLFLGAIWIVYSRLRPEPRLAALARTALMFAAYTHGAAVLSYLLTAANPTPLLDPQFAAIDRALGLNWLGFYRWIGAGEARKAAAAAIYNSLGSRCWS